MSYIHFKPPFNKNYDMITFDGVSLSVAELKKMICMKCKITRHRKVDIDLEITNAETNKGTT